MNAVWFPHQLCTVKPITFEKQAILFIIKLDIFLLLLREYAHYTEVYLVDLALTDTCTSM